MFSEQATSPPWIRAERFFDIDSQAARYRGYGQEYQQLSRGPFEGRVTSFDFGGDFAVQFETANQDLAQAATTPAGRCGVCILTEASPPCTLNGATLARDHLLVCPGGKGLVGKTPAGFNIYCMDLSCDLLLEEAAEWRSIEVLHDASGAQSLHEVVESGLATFAQRQSLGQHAAAVRAFKSSVADALWWAVSRTAIDAGGGVPRQAKLRALRHFRIAREYIHHHLTDGVSVAEVCRHTGVSRSSLESIFRSFVDIGPGSYIRNLQLNRVRRHLLLNDEPGESIGDIAARHGVWHWSRFSQSYKRLFGELPSQTRARETGLGTRTAPGSVNE